jgi:hypothetical protein
MLHVKNISLCQQNIIFIKLNVLSPIIIDLYKLCFIRIIKIYLFGF